MRPQGHLALVLVGQTDGGISSEIAPGLKEWALRAFPEEVALKATEWTWYWCPSSVWMSLAWFGFQSLTVLS